MSLGGVPSESERKHRLIGLRVVLFDTRRLINRLVRDTARASDRSPFTSISASSAPSPSGRGGDTAPIKAFRRCFAYSRTTERRVRDYPETLPEIPGGIARGSKDYKLPGDEPEEADHRGREKRVVVA